MPTFEPPTTPQALHASDVLYSRYTIPVGLSVVLTDGHYAVTPYPWLGEIENLQEGVEWFQGGRVYTIDSTTAAALTADGFTVTADPTTITVIAPTDPVTITDHLPNLSPTGGSESGSAGVVGSSPQWSDASDSSYARVLTVNGVGTDYATVPIPTLTTNPAEILSASLTVRVSAPSGTAASVNFRIAKSDGDPDGLVGDADPDLIAPLPGGDVPATFTVPLDWEFSDPIADVLVQSPLAIYIWASGTNKDIKVYEVSLSVELAS